MSHYLFLDFDGVLLPDELQRDLRAARAAATSAERNALLARKRSNRSIGLNAQVAEALEARIFRFIREP